MKKILRIGLSVAALFVCGAAAAQPPAADPFGTTIMPLRVPFYQAYAPAGRPDRGRRVPWTGKLLVGHEVEELSPDMTFEALYGACRDAFQTERRTRLEGFDRHLQPMVELKSETGPTLRAVAEVLGRWPEVFDPAVNP